MKPLASLTIFFPALNDAPTIGGLVEQAFAVGNSCTRELEVLVVDDGSTDETPQLLAELAGRYPGRLRIARHPRNQGYGAALHTGFRLATKEFVFYTDGDGQYHLDDLPRLISEWAPGVGLVNGYKVRRADPWYRTILGGMYAWWVRRLFRLAIRDVDCDYRLIHRRVLDKVLPLTCRGGAVCVELVAKIQATGCRIVEVPVNHWPRTHGRSQFFRPGNLYQTAVELARLRRSLALASPTGPPLKTTICSQDS